MALVTKQKFPHSKWVEGEILLQAIVNPTAQQFHLRKGCIVVGEEGRFYYHIKIPVLSNIF